MRHWFEHNGERARGVMQRCGIMASRSAGPAGWSVSIPRRTARERPPDHPEIREAMKEIAGKRRRFGYRRIGVLLECKGSPMNHKKLYRLYREEGKKGCR